MTVVLLKHAKYNPAYKQDSYQCDVKVVQLCLTLCDPVDYTVHGILQSRILKWVAYPFSSRSI